jgi:hypothetical protein
MREIAMSKKDTSAGFNTWWDLLPAEAKKGLDRRLAWMAFAAGCRYRSNPPKKTFRFRAGRWIVSVNAETFEDARVMASEKLDQRAERLGATPPPNGWPLTKLANSA